MRWGGYREALALQLIVAAGTCLCIAVLAPACQRLNEPSRIDAGFENLKRLGLVLKVYANDQENEFWLPLAPVNDLWVPDIARLSGRNIERLQREGLYDPTMWVNPRLPDAAELRKEMGTLLAEPSVDWERVYRIIAKGYAYLNWYVPDEAAFEEVKQRYEAMTPFEYGRDIEAENVTYYRLQGQIHRYFMDPDPRGDCTVRPSQIPALFEITPGKARGVNVMFMDGRVELMAIGSAFPATEGVMQVFSAEERSALERSE